MEQIKKKKSRDAARQRRGQQNDEFSELAAQLPLPESMTEKLDRLCVMRLSNSYIKIKHVLQQVNASKKELTKFGLNEFTSCIQDALGGFLFVLAEDGQCLYMSQNVTENLGLQQLEVTGHSIYKYVHPCDQDDLAKQLGGQVPLEDMEIFDGLYCGDNSHFVKNPKQAISSELEKSPHRSFFLRMKSTLTSRGKSVNINASIYRVVHCTGTIQMYRTKLGTSDSSMTRCLLAVGSPLLSSATFEVPVDRQTFITKHSLDMKISEIENLGSDIIGYGPQTMLGTSWYLYTHICDSHVLKDCHDTVLKQGQAVSGYYRVLVTSGGWIWMQTKANMVYLSTTGQPQYIICVHYVISGLELEDQLLSSEQLMSSRPIRKRARAVEDERHMAPMKKLFNAKQEYVEARKPHVDELSEEDELGQDIDDSDMPGLEFLEVTDDFEDFEGFAARSPFIPPPFIDTELKASNVDGDLTSILEESELLNRAPYIPPPCIDKIMSFDDLSMSGLDDYDIPLANNCQIPSTQSLMNSALPSNMNQFYDIGNAKVPLHLLSKYSAANKLIEKPKTEVVADGSRPSR